MGKMEERESMDKQGEHFVRIGGVVSRLEKLSQTFLTLTSVLWSVRDDPRSAGCVLASSGRVEKVN